MAIALVSARVINYAPRVMLQIVASLTDDSRGVIYNCHGFIVQATGCRILTMTSTLVYYIIVVKRFILLAFCSGKRERERQRERDWKKT